MSKTKQKVILASGNKGKLLELQEILHDLPFELLPQAQTSAYHIEETGTTFVENAIIKARHAAELSGLPAIADDSGLVIAALNGEPGIKTARYAGENSGGQDNMDKILRKLKPFAKKRQRQATFVCALVYMRNAQDPLPIIAIGQWHGAITRQKHGLHGFGYDPVFWDFKHKMTAAQMPKSLKSKLSHRGKACKKLKQKLKKQK